MRHRSRTALVVVAIALGCGSRSDLLLDRASSSGGSAGTGGAGGLAGSAGIGGVPPVTSCNRLELVPPVLTVDPAPDPSFDDYLRFTPSSDDDRQITGVFLRGTAAYPVVQHATLSPWQSWPSSSLLAPAFSTFLEVRTLVVPARSPGGHWAFAAGTEEGLDFVPERDPLGPAGDPYEAMPLPGSDPIFVAARAPGLSGATHLVGTYEGSGRLLAQLVTEKTDIDLLPALGCASGQPPRASATAFGDGWIAALSNGSAGVGVCSSGIVPGYPQRIDVLRIGGDGARTELGAVPTGMTIDVAVARHPDGAYVVWSSSSGGSTPGVWALRVVAAEAGAPSLVGPIQIGDPGEDSSSFVIASVGRLLAIARRAESAAITISVHDESLTELVRIEHPASALWGPSSAIGSPDGIGVLVAWTGPVTDPTSVHLARFDCGD